MAAGSSDGSLFGGFKTTSPLANKPPTMLGVPENEPGATTVSRTLSEKPVAGDKLPSAPATRARTRTRKSPVSTPNASAGRISGTPARSASVSFVPSAVVQ